MIAIDTIDSTKFEAGIQYLNVYLFFPRKTCFALVIKIYIIPLLSTSLQPTLNWKSNRPSHWSINKLITGNDRIEDTCCRIETITGYQFIYWNHTDTDMI